MGGRGWIRGHEVLHSNIITRRKGKKGGRERKKKKKREEGRGRGDCNGK